MIGDLERDEGEVRQNLIDGAYACLCDAAACERKSLFELADGFRRLSALRFRLAAAIQQAERAL